MKGLRRIAHVDWDDHTIVAQIGEPSDAAVAFVILGRLLMKTGAFRGRDLELATELLERLVPAENMPQQFIVPR